VLLLPLALTAGLLGLSFLPRVQQHPTLIWSFWGTVIGLLVWQGWLRQHLEGAAPRRFDVVLRKQHWIQAILHTSVFIYWGTYWAPVADHFWLLVGQLLFCYVFDMLLAWSRRERYTLGFGPFPILFSTNLFLWFHDDWFYLQFLMLGVGFLGKEFVRWNRDGRRVHIFNPSAFSLGLFSLALLATGTTNLTWGDQIATTLNLAPQPYLFLFVVGLVAMYFFSITLVSAFAAAALFGLSALYTQIVGVPFFIDSEIPIAVFLGLHLLVTDPSTSPRTASGKLIFGLLYGATVFGLYELLGLFQQPTFYDKLLCVPLLNLGVQRIDQLAKKLPQTFLVGRRAPHRRQPRVLGGGLRQRSAKGVRDAGIVRGPVLPGRLRLGLQRDGRTLRRGRHRRAQPGILRLFVRAGLPARVRARLLQHLEHHRARPRRSGDRRPAAAPERGGPAAHRLVRRGALRPRLRARVGVRLRQNRWMTFPGDPPV
jgi:hypothetical protein